MRSKLNTNDILEDNDENSRLSNLIKIIKKSDKIKQIKNLHDTSEYNMIRALQNASSELQIYYFIPRSMYVVSDIVGKDSKRYDLATCTDAEFDICIKYIKHANENIASYRTRAEEALKKQKESSESKKK